MSRKKPSPEARLAAEEILRALGREDLLYAHYGDVHARPNAYDALGRALDVFADARCKRIHPAPITEKGDRRG